jgi:hypothetical protein
VDHQFWGKEKKKNERTAGRDERERKWAEDLGDALDVTFALLP